MLSLKQAGNLTVIVFYWQVAGRWKNWRGFWYNLPTMKLPLTIKVFYEGTSKDAPWVSYNPELDVASCGPTEKKARENLKEAIDIVLSGAKEDGNLKELLKSAGFTIKGKSV